MAVADSYVIIDEILSDANIFKAKEQKGLLVCISRDEEVRYVLLIIAVYLYLILVPEGEKRPCSKIRYEGGSGEDFSSLVGPTKSYYALH